jgi:hypothetical protein
MYNLNLFSNVLTRNQSSLAILIIAILLSFNFNSFPQTGTENKIKVTYKGDAQLETGSSFVGLEFHHNSPIIERISFYYPVSNSVDLSNDYWKRDSSFVMAAAIKTDDRIEWLNHNKYEFTSTPYYVSYNSLDKEKQVRITYNFLKNKPVYTVTFEITNKSARKKSFELYTDLEANLKSSHTYKIKDKAWTNSEIISAAPLDSISDTASPVRNRVTGLFIHYDDPEVQNVSLFSINKETLPVSFSTKSVLSKVPVSNNDWWNNSDLSLNNEIIDKGNPGLSAFRYLYKKELAPGEKMTVTQVIGTAKQEEAHSFAEDSYLNCSKEINDYRNYVLGYVNENHFTTGDNYIDKTVLWSDAMLAVNKHYIDGSVQPMPCPAEYYFYFTHDVLLTNLAAVNFDLPRVKQDLSFITAHADKNKVIPHAYYWMDSSFVTEYADSDNWNHFWFVIAAAKYLLHSGDKEFIEKIFPYIKKSITMAMSNKHDDLMWALRPDWWDIGRNYGPRAYMTILATKSLREFTYICSVLDKEKENLTGYSLTSLKLEQGLNTKLWNNDQHYLLNYFADGSLDKHYYIGSLLASHFGLLNPERNDELNSTASKILLDKKTGIYTVYPMDFQKLIDYLKFSGNEAGDEYHYINGGIWSHGNAWYALSLISAGKKNEAFSFIKNTMTLNGILDGPNGQPAMYEVRYGNYKDKNIYGRIDKPQFMWAAGWYLYSLYNLFVFKENDWNIAFDPWMPGSSRSLTLNLTVNGSKTLTTVKGEGKFIQSVKIDGKEIPSAVIPASELNIKKIDIVLGAIQTPYLKEINSALNEINYDKDKRSLKFKVSSFEGNKITAKIVSSVKPKLVSPTTAQMSSVKLGSAFITTITFTASNEDEVELLF